EGKAAEQLGGHQPPAVGVELRQEPGHPSKRNGRPVIADGDPSAPEAPFRRRAIAGDDQAAQN
ncbi:MAG TPA: hypothetical protein VEW45_00430, partial [Candidatus Dormibacteraeota bacterium]|nr:hypothetical protein [Candidatus Dormibacteraeota bacterium]